MKSTLWIPCKNEWTQAVQLRSRDLGFFEGERHPIYETLNLMKTRILWGLFSQVIITDDGSDDDTLEWIERFQNEHNLSSTVFRIVRWKSNEWKLARFLEAFTISTDSDVFVMTDADMVDPSPSTFEKLSLKSLPSSSSENRTMFVSLQGEYHPSSGHYEIGQTVTWTRSLVIEKVKDVFTLSWITDTHFPWSGFALEPFLNHLFGGDQMMYVNRPRLEEVPLFLRAFRKWRERQLTEQKDAVPLLEAFLAWKRSTVS